MAAEQDRDPYCQQIVRVRRHRNIASAHRARNGPCDQCGQGVLVSLALAGRRVCFCPAGGCVPAPVGGVFLPQPEGVFLLRPEGVFLPQPEGVFLPSQGGGRSCPS